MKIGFCNGCFDGLHEGHKFFLKEALSVCDYLLIGVNSDLSIRQMKGPQRPLHTLEQRLKDLGGFLWLEQRPRNGYGRAALVPFEGNDRALIHCVRPQVIIKSEEYRNEGYWDIFRGHGEISVVWVPRKPELGSTTERAHG